MTHKEWKAAVKKFDGWIEEGVARFPSVYLKDEFLNYVAGCGRV